MTVSDLSGQAVVFPSGNRSSLATSFLRENTKTFLGLLFLTDHSQVGFYSFDQYASVGSGII